MIEQAQTVLFDWSQPLISDIMVVNADQECPSGWKPLFTNTWPGYQETCDCIKSIDPLKESEQSSDFQDVIIQDRIDDFKRQISFGQCSQEQLEQGCQTRPKVNPIEQDVILGKRICGGMMRETWANIQRPTDTDHEICERDRVFCEHYNVQSGDVCPQGFDLCNSTSIQQAICIKSGTPCPITQIKFQKSDPDLPLKLNENVSISFQREKSTFYPITQFDIKFEACKNHSQQGSSKGRKYDPGLDTDGTGCKPDPFTGETFDSSQLSIASLNELSLESDSQVLSLISAYPHSDLFFSDIRADKKSIKYKVLTKQAFGFDRFCEIYGGYTREMANEDLREFVKSQERTFSPGILWVQVTMCVLTIAGITLITKPCDNASNKWNRRLNVEYRSHTFTFPFLVANTLFGLISVIVFSVQSKEDHTI